MDGIELTRRQCEYISVLLEADDYVSSKEISKKVKRSSRTVKADMRVLKETLLPLGIHLNAKTGKGYLLAFSKPENRTWLWQYLKEEQKRQSRSVPDTEKKRELYILQQLLLERRKVTLSGLSEELFIHIPSIRRDMKHIRLLLEEFNIRLLHAPYKGYFLEGNELAKRNCICHMLGTEGIVSALKEKESEADKKHQLVKKRVQTLAKKYEIEFDDAALGFLSDYLCVLPLWKDASPSCLLKNGEEGRELSLAKELCCELEQIFGRTFEEEAKALSLVIRCKRRYGEEELTLAGREVVRQMLRKIHQKFGLELWKQESFAESLKRHLPAFVYRARLGLTDRLPILREVLCYHPMAVDIVNEAAAVLTEGYQLPVNEYEFGTLVLYFATALDYLDAKRRRKILITAPGGDAEAMLYVNQISQAFGNLVKSIEICSMEDLGGLAFDGDEILAGPKPVPEVPPYMKQVILTQNSFENIIKIYEALTEIPQGTFNLDEMISEKWFLRQQSFQNQGEYYERLFDHLCETRTLDLEEARKLYERVEPYGQEIGRGVVMLRSCNPYVNPFIHFTLLKQPMQWKEEFASMVIFINVSDGDFEYRSNIYKHLNYLLWNRDNINYIIMKQTYELLFEFLHMDWSYKRMYSINAEGLPVFTETGC